MTETTRRKIAEFSSRFGWTKTVLRMLTIAMERLSLFRIDCFVVLDPESMTMNQYDSQPKLERRFLTAREMRQYQDQNPELLSDDFLKIATHRNDLCYAFFDSDKLVSFGWYAADSCQIRRMKCKYADDYVFMYRGYTAPEYRGQRLHALGLMEALRNLVWQGKKALISTVSISNYSSRRSIERLGFKYRGYICKFGSGRWTFSFVSPTPQQYGLEITH